MKRDVGKGLSGLVPDRLKPLIRALAGLLALTGGPAPAVADDRGTERPAARARATEAPALPFRSCINLGNALDAPREGEWGYRIRREDLKRIASAGFDAVRLPVAWSEHTTSWYPHRIDRAVLHRVDTVIRQALDAGLTVILDVHHFGAIMREPDENMPRLEAIWTQLSDHYADWPDGLVFEFLNEPRGDMTAARVDAMNARLLDLVRKRHPSRWVIMSGSDWGLIDGLLEADIPDDPRAIGSFHYYHPFDFTHQGASFMPDPPPLDANWGSPEDIGHVEDTMAAAARWRERTGMPVFLGEFGVYAGADTAVRAKWIRSVREEAEARDISWCHWDWATTFRIYDMDRERWLASLRSALKE